MGHPSVHTRTRAEIWRGFTAVERREVGTVVVSTLQSQSTSALLLLLLSLLALRVTGSPASAPLVVAVGALPALLLVRAVRTVNQHVDHRWVMLLSDAGAFVVAVTLWQLVRAGGVHAWQIYAGMFLFAAFGAFYLPAMRGWVAGQTTGLEQLTWLNAMLAVATQAAVVVGWALGGVLASSIGIQVSLGLCALSYAVGLVLQFVVFVVVNRAPFRKPAGAVGAAEPDQAGADRASGGTRVWRDVFSPRRLGLFTAALLLMELTHTLGFSMFVPLLTGGAADRSWIAGTANACFALAAMISGVLVSGGALGQWTRARAPQVVLVGFGVQIVFGLSAAHPVWAIGLYAVVGLLSGGDAALQSEVQDRWRPAGSAQAFAVFGAVQGPAQLVGSLTVAALLTCLSVGTVYLGTVVVLGLGSGVVLMLARSRAEVRPPRVEAPV
ncbi:MFS transporter [Streptomyces lunalinharesii]|uniref:MFS transporter n=1 Tax=Streptomyces lunalinharesii TaxID=333384 RepID=A0ABN3S2R3_9ACTN